MAGANKFQPYVEKVNEKKIDSGADQFTILLSNVLPTGLEGFQSQITEIAYTNLGARDFTTLSSAQTGGIYKLVLQSLVIAATGPVATFQYAILCDRTPGAAAINPVCLWYDYGSPITMANGQTISFNVSATDGVLKWQ